VGVGRGGEVWDVTPRWEVDVALVVAGGDGVGVDDMIAVRELLFRVRISRGLF
jgi:hypothetical protein